MLKCYKLTVFLIILLTTIYRHHSLRQKAAQKYIYSVTIYLYWECLVECFKYLYNSHLPLKWAQYLLW